MEKREIHSHEIFFSSNQFAVKFFSKTLTWRKFVKSRNFHSAFCTDICPFTKISWNHSTYVGKCKNFVKLFNHILRFAYSHLRLSRFTIPPIFETLNKQKLISRKFWATKKSSISLHCALIPFLTFLITGSRPEVELSLDRKRVSSLSNRYLLSDCKRAYH